MCELVMGHWTFSKRLFKSSEIELSHKQILTAPPTMLWKFGFSTAGTSVRFAIQNSNP